jgi:hypothetical protein
MSPSSLSLRRRVLVSNPINNELSEKHTYTICNFIYCTSASDACTAGALYTVDKDTVSYLDAEILGP